MVVPSSYLSGRSESSVGSLLYRLSCIVPDAKVAYLTNLFASGRCRAKILLSVSDRRGA